MAENENVTDTLEKQYFDLSHEAGFSGARNLIRLNKKEIRPKQIYNWLQKHDAYTLHKPVRKKFHRLKYNVTYIDQVWELDLQDMRTLKNYNDGVSYLLVAIDVFSKFVWVEPLQDKSSQEVTNAFEKILDRSKNRFPYMVQTDRGKEFIGSSMQAFLRDNDIRFRVVRNPDVKAAVVERVNRTLKERMWRYFTHKNTRRYIDVLQLIVKAYNNTKHSSIKMTPASVNLQNSKQTLKNLEQSRARKIPKRNKAKYQVGDYVRISREKNVFEKGYVRGWQEEIFKIHKIIKRQNIFIYILEDLQQEEIEGFFYPEELSAVNPVRVEQKEYKIEKILETKGKGSYKQYFVKWLGYPDKFNSWVSASEMVDL